MTGSVGTATTAPAQPAADERRDLPAAERPAGVPADRPQAQPPRRTGAPVIVPVAPSVPSAPLTPAELNTRVQNLQRGFAARDIQSVLRELHGVPVRDREAVRTAFDAVPANRRPGMDFNGRVQSLVGDASLQEVMRDGLRSTVARMWQRSTNVAAYEAIATPGNETGRYDGVARLHEMMAGSGIDRDGVVQLYRGLTRAQVGELHEAYAARHGMANGDAVATELDRRFGSQRQSELAVARMGSDQRTNDHEIAGQLAATTNGSGDISARARILGEQSARGNIAAVRAAYESLYPGQQFDAQMRERLLPTQMQALNSHQLALRARVDAALAGDTVGYVAHSATQLANTQRGNPQSEHISEADARAAIGMVNGTNVTWAAVDERTRREMGGSVTTRLLDTPRHHDLAPETQALLASVTSANGPNAAIANQTEQPSVRAAGLDRVLNQSLYPTDLTGLTSYRRRAFTSALESIPQDQRGAVEDAYRQQTGRNIRDDIAYRFSGIARERALADWAGNIDDAAMLRFASRGEATREELGRAVGATDAERRGTLEARYNERYGSEGSGGRDAYRTALQRLRREDGEAARNLDVQLGLARLATPDGRNVAMQQAENLLREGRGDWNSFRRVMMDTFKWSGAQVDSSGRELFTSIERAHRNGTLIAGQPVPADVDAAYRSFTNDYQRFLRDQGRLGEAAGEVAMAVGGVALAAVTAGLGTGVVIGVGASAAGSAGLYVAARAGVSPVYADNGGQQRRDFALLTAAGMVGVNPTAAGSVRAARAAGTAAQAISHSARPSVAAGLETRFGSFVGISGTRPRPGFPEFSTAIHPRVQQVLDAVPMNLRDPRHHAMCAEPRAISRALEAGVPEAELQNSHMTATLIRGNGSPKHGQVVEPCASCARMLEAFRISHHQ